MNQIPAEVAKNGRKTTAVRISAALSLIAALALAAGLAACATKQSASKPPPPRDDVAEFRKIVVESLKTTKAALHSLDDVGVQASADPTAAVQLFAGDVQRLEVESIRMRSRALAMEQRGEAYFAQWHEHLAAHPDEAVRKAAEQNHERLQASFTSIQTTSQQLRAAFKPFLSSLRQARAILQQQPDLAGVDSAKATILSAHKSGREVHDQLTALLAELNTVAVLLKSQTPSSAKP